MQPYVRLREDRRTSRRTVADALEVVREEFGLDEIAPAQIRIGLLRLPSGQRTALADVVFPDLGCVVSLPTSARFRALSETSSRHEEFQISRLEGAEVCFDGSVLLSDGIRLHAVEVTPTLLPYEPSEREERILRHVISRTKSAYCYRNFREDLPEHLQDQVPDLWVLDYSRVRMIEAPLLKVIRGYIEDNDPELKVSNQKIADALAKFGVRVPRRCPRTASALAIEPGTI